MVAFIIRKHNEWLGMYFGEKENAKKKGRIENKRKVKDDECGMI